jgi:hypothetical protein
MKQQVISAIISQLLKLKQIPLWGKMLIATAGLTLGTLSLTDLSSLIPGW